MSTNTTERHIVEYEDFIKLIKDVGMDVKEFSEYMGLNAGTIRSWNSERTKRRTPYWVEPLLTLLKENQELKAAIKVLK